MTIISEVKLPSSDSTVSVRRLGLFELDLIEKAIPGPYTVTIRFLNGTEYEQEFDMSRPRPKPDIPLDQVDERSPEWYAWQEHLRFQEALLHQKRQADAYAAYLDRVAAYILENCVGEADRRKIVTAEDYSAVYQAALCPQVTFEDIRAVTRNLYEATFNDEDVFDALAESKPGAAAYNWLAQAEGELQVALGDTEDEYLKRSVRERARLIMAIKLPKITDSLAAQEAMERHREAEKDEVDDRQGE